MERHLNDVRVLIQGIDYVKPGLTERENAGWIEEILH
jgi:hypothetical protein